MSGAELPPHVINPAPECQTCWYWDRPSEWGTPADEPVPGPIWGMCGRMGCTGGEPDDLHPEAYAAAAGAGPGQRAEVFTHPTFGCVMWEPMPAPAEG